MKKNKIKSPCRCARPAKGRNKRSSGRATFVLPFYSFLRDSSRKFKWKRALRTPVGAGETKAGEPGSAEAALKRVLRTAAHKVFVNMDYRASDSDLAANLAARSATELQFRRYPE